jgi:hypothetical protein
MKLFTLEYQVVDAGQIRLVERSIASGYPDIAFTPANAMSVQSTTR